jgi:hypothetical protein
MWGAGPSVVAGLVNDEKYLSGARVSIGLAMDVDTATAFDPKAAAGDIFKVGSF